MEHSAEDLFALAPVIPVIAIDNLDHALPLAQALVQGGLCVLEITLRTACALEAIELIAREVPGAIVGAGTVLNGKDLDNALAAGSQFVLTPGLTPDLLRAGATCGLPFIPGVATASELMCCLDAGLTAMKFFPAETSGGPKALRAFGGPFPSVSFCPTGGVTPENLPNYLSVPSVKTVGGSWLSPRKLIADGDWSGIRALAQDACDRAAYIRKELGAHKDA